MLHPTLLPCSLSKPAGAGPEATKVLAAYTNTSGAPITDFTLQVGRRGAALSQAGATFEWVHAAAVLA